MPEATVASYIKKILSAIGYLHSLDIIHRDLKPGNIILCSKNDKTDIKLIDFGLSAKYSGESLKSIVGTINFVAPEVYI